MKKAALPIFLLVFFLISHQGLTQERYSVIFPIRYAFAARIFLNFDELKGGFYPFPKDLYKSYGVIFSSETGGDPWLWGNRWYKISVLRDAYGGAFSLYNAIGGNSRSTLSMFADFVEPGSNIPCSTGFVSVGVSSGPGPDPLSPDCALLAYDRGGKLIAADYADTNLQYETLTVIASDIARVKMVAGELGDIFDDFGFDIPIMQVVNGGPRLKNNPAGNDTMLRRFLKLSGSRNPIRYAVRTSEVAPLPKSAELFYGGTIQERALR